MLREGALSGYELAATAEGFWQADQAELLAGYVPGYFATLPALGGGLARVWARHGFPHYAADAAAVLAGERCLETGGITGSLRRLLADQLEDLRRSLAVRSAG
jgi:aminopeptidase N